MPKTIPLKLPPGVVRAGTKYEARGRWYDCNLVRWVGQLLYGRFVGTIAPWGGWTHVQSWSGETPTDIDVNEAIRGSVAWLTNDQAAYLGFGTPTKLYVFSQGTLTDITPDDLTTGGTDATSTTGNYNNGAYGVGMYGEGNPAISTIVEAQTWQLDNYGEDMVGLAYSDRRIFYWDKSVGGDATVLANAPTSNRGVVVTPERFVVALGAGGDGRKVQWSDQEGPTTWTPDPANQAGAFTLPGAGEILAGRRSRSETLIWSTVDLFSMRYVAGVAIYSFQTVGRQCGAISRMSMVMAGSGAYWMGNNKFFQYDGFVKEISDDVVDYVFGDMNRTQASKIFCVSLAERSTVIWFYPSAGSTENDRYVAYNWSTNHWEIGALQRTAGVDRGAFDYPIMADATGALYDHERGWEYEDHNDVALTPYAESGPIEIADGQNILDVVEIVPDEKTLGDVQLTMYIGEYPTSTETSYGPFTASTPTQPRGVSARQVRLKLTQVGTNWRFGTPRLRVEIGGER